MQTCCHLGRIDTKLYTYIFAFFINLFLLVSNVLQCTSKPQKDGMKKKNSIEKKAVDCVANILGAHSDSFDSRYQQGVYTWDYRLEPYRK